MPVSLSLALIALLLGSVVVFTACIPSAQALPTAFDPLLAELPAAVPALEKVESTAYAPDQLRKLSKGVYQVELLRSRLEAFRPSIEKRDWGSVHKAVSAVLPELKDKMRLVTDQLTLSDRIFARSVATEVFIHLERIDEADEVNDYQAAETNYLQALQDFDLFLEMIPSA
jgi:photosystem II protein PsbQ